MRRIRAILGLEIWTVRLAAVTGLIFVPGLTLPAYIAACFIMDSEPGDSAAAPAWPWFHGGASSAVKRSAGLSKELRALVESKVGASNTGHTNGQLGKYCNGRRVEC